MLSRDHFSTFQGITKLRNRLKYFCPIRRKIFLDFSALLAIFDEIQIANGEFIKAFAKIEEENKFYGNKNMIFSQ